MLTPRSGVVEMITSTVHVPEETFLPAFSPNVEKQSSLLLTFFPLTSKNFLPQILSLYSRLANWIHWKEKKKITIKVYDQPPLVTWTLTQKTTSNQISLQQTDFLGWKRDSHNLKKEKYIRSRLIVTLWIVSLFHPIASLKNIYTFTNKFFVFKNEILYTF